MVCLHCLSIFGFLLAIIFEIARKTFGLSFGGLFGRKEVTEEGDQAPTEKPPTCPYIPKKTATEKPKTD
jgi:hypothetical protein